MKLILAIGAFHLLQTCKFIFNKRPKPARWRLCCEKLGTSHDIKSFTIGSFVDGIVVERANNYLCWENVKNAGQIIAKPDQFSAKFVQKTPTKSAIFYRLFLSEVYRENSHKNPAKSANISVNLSLTIPHNLTFFSATYQKPCIRHSQAVFFFFFFFQGKLLYRQAVNIKLIQ